jgi:hypothetical protein
MPAYAAQGGYAAGPRAAFLRLFDQGGRLSLSLERAVGGRRADFDRGRLECRQVRRRNRPPRARARVEWRMASQTCAFVSSPPA